jgi:hypothetical protein
MNFLKRLWTSWKRIARKIGDFQARVILGVFYFVILAPFTLIVRSSDPLAMGGKRRSGWLERPPSERPTPEQAMRQF